MKQAKRLPALLLAVLLMASALGTAAFAAEGYIATDSYVLNYNGGYDSYKWQYFSPYYPAYTYDGYSDYTQSIIFTLYNTRTGESFPVFCTDIDTGLDNNSDYRRVNLEDSTYAAAGAGLIRSIVLKGFPNVSAAELGEAAGVENLTVGEAVAATQAAVWRAAHGTLLNFTDFCYAIDCDWSSAQNKYYDLCVAEYAAYGFTDGEYYSDPSVTGKEDLIESHIEAAFNYLVNLAPTAPTGVALSNASFVSWSSEPTVTVNEDGTCSVTVTATVDVEMTDADSLTLSAVVGGYHADAPLSNGTSTVTLTIENVPASAAGGDVTLAIDGTQTVSDVFLFDATGDRGDSQSLVGIDDSQLPVHAEVTVETERIINFVKTTKEATGNDTYQYVPLEGIVFDIYYIGSLAQYESGALNLNGSIPSDNPDFTVTTDENGRASFSLTRNNMEDGVYLIAEREHPAIKKPVDPFCVVMPMTGADGASLVYEVTVQPKNEVEGGVDIKKDVISLGSDEASVDAYADHTWIITASIPTDIADGKSYVISDTLDSRLDYVGNVAVNVEIDTTTTTETTGEDGITVTEEVITSEVALTLTSGVDYILSASSEAYPHSFTVALTAAGMDKVAPYANTGVLRVRFDAKINSAASMGEEIPNQAALDYTNSVGYDFDAESDIPKVYTGGANLRKMDADDESRTLAGAVFEVYRPATAEEAAAGTGLVRLEGLDTPMVQVSFYDNTALLGEKVTAVTSDEDGSVVIWGLAYGTYYLVEIQAPAGYNRLSGPVAFTVSANSHTGENTVKVLNSAGTTLPETGGIGTTSFYAAGGILVLAAVVLLVTRRRMRAED